MIARITIGTMITFCSTFVKTAAPSRPPPSRAVILFLKEKKLCISDSSIRAGRFRFLCDHRYARDSSVSYLYDHLAGSILFLSYIAGYRHKTVM